MQNRLRLLMGATALLYFGPLLAGLGGFGWNLVPVFVAIFLLWLFILRPQQWPRRAADWARSEALVTLAAQGAVQVLLVAVLFGVGRGIGGVLGSLPAFPVMLPVAISFLSIPLCRLIWDPWKAGEMERFLDDAIRAIERPGEAAAARRAGATALAGRLIEALPQGLTPAETEAHLTAMEAEADPHDLAEALIARAEIPHLRQALVVHATMDRVVSLLNSGYPTTAFTRCAGEDALTGLFAIRCAAMLAADPDLWYDCPQAELVEARAADASPETAKALHALAALTRQVAPAEETEAL